MMTKLGEGTRIGQYTLSSLLGQTAMGEVWMAQKPTGETVALKTISPNANDYDLSRERFLREIEIHRSLRHAHIVPIHECFELDDRLYLIMDYIPGGSLENRIDGMAGMPLPLDEALRVSSQILSALDYAHQHDVIHRDVKPSNILLNGDCAYLTDFGISLPVGAKRLTSVKQVVGTRFYMSPEQIVTPLKVTHLTDVFSFGCVLYEMLTGRQPFAGDCDPNETSDYSAQERQVKAVAQPLRELNSNVSERLERIVLTSLAKKPEERFPGCGSFARALRGAAQQGAAGLQPETPETSISPGFVPPSVTTAAPEKRVQPVNPSKRVSVALYVTLALISGCVAFVPVLAGAGADARQGAFSVASVLSDLLLLVLLYKCRSQIQDEFARVDFQGAIVLTAQLTALVFKFAFQNQDEFAPRALVEPGRHIFVATCCGFIWLCFYFLYAARYNAFVERHQPSAKRQSKAWYVTFALWHFTLPLTLAFWPVVFGSYLYRLYWFIDFFILVPICCLVMAKSVNALHQSAQQTPLAAMAKSA